MNEIDDIFKDAAQTEQATFKPEYWDQYAEQFSGKEKKRKGVFGFFLGETLFVVCIILLAYNNSFEPTVAEFASHTTQIETNSNTEELSKKTFINNELSNINNSDNDLNEEQVTGLMVGNSQSYNEVSSRQNDFNLSQETTEVSTQSESTNGQVTSAFTNNSFVNNTTSFQDNKSETTIVRNETDKGAQIEVEKEDKKTIKEQAIDKGSNIKIEQTPTALDSNSPMSLASTVPESIENQDSASNFAAKPENKSSVVTRSRMKKLQFNFQIGGIAYNDFNLSQNARDIKTGLFAGIEVEYLLKPNLIISLGVNGYTRNSDGLYIDFDYLDKGFGEVNSKKSYSYTDLYFIEVPVNLNYIISSRHKIGAGPIFTRLLTTKVNVNEEIKDVKNNSNTRRSSDEYLYHYNTFELNNVGINLNYQYMFNRVGLSLGYTHGLNEFLNKDTFNSNRFNSLNKFNLSIKYKL